MSCNEPCEYCYVPPPPVTSCNPCVPCRGTAITCNQVVSVVMTLSSTACTALLSISESGTHLQALEGAVEPVAFQFTNPSCDSPFSEVQLDGALTLYSWIDPLTPGLLRLGTTGAVPFEALPLLARPWNLDSFSTCDPLPLVSSVNNLHQQLQVVVKGDAAFNLAPGQVVIVLDTVRVGWGPVGAAQLMPAWFQVYE